MSATGSIVEWWVEAGEDKDDPSRGEYTIHFGHVGGATQSTTTNGICGKNVGKKNATSGPEQAMKEAAALFNKQRDRKGYTEEYPSSVPFRPMLAKKYLDRKKKIKWPALAAPKLDGIRCIAYLGVDGEVVLMSRAGKRFTTLQHIEQAVKPILQKGYVLDGELYNHKYKREFQKLISLIKRDDPLPETKLVEYHVYDLVSAEDYEARHEVLSSLLIGISGVYPVLSEKVYNEEEFEAYHDRAVSEGYEGAMLRNLKGGYELNKLSNNLLKYKKFDTDDFPIISAEENVGKQAGECCLVCVTSDGKQFSVKPIGTSEERAEYWQMHLNGELVGKYLTVKYFGLTDEGKPRFPIGICVRDYE